MVLVVAIVMFVCHCSSFFKYSSSWSEISLHCVVVFFKQMTKQYFEAYPGIYFWVFISEYFFKRNERKFKTVQIRGNASLLSVTALPFYLFFYEPMSSHCRWPLISEYFWVESRSFVMQGIVKDSVGNGNGLFCFHISYKNVNPNSQLLVRSIL